MTCGKCRLKYLLATGVCKKDNEYKCLVFPCKSCHESDMCQDERRRIDWLDDELNPIPVPNSSNSIPNPTDLEECMCRGQLDAFSELFSTIFNEPVTFVNVDCPIHGHKPKPRKKRSKKEKKDGQN
jgi:hypothetical protein